MVTDHFKRIAQEFPCKDQSAKKVVRVLWESYFKSKHVLIMLLLRNTFRSSLTRNDG